MKIEEGEKLLPLRTQDAQTRVYKSTNVSNILCNRGRPNQMQQLLK